MPQNDNLKRYLDAGMQFTQLSREKAEEFVKELVKAGELRRKETESAIETLLERSRKNTEDLVNLIRSEVADQLRNLGLEDLVKRAGLPDKGAVARAADKVDDAARGAAKTVAPKKAAAKKAPAAKKAAAGDAGAATKAAPAKSPQRSGDAASAGTPTKKAAAKKAAATKATAKKAAPAKKAPPAGTGNVGLGSPAEPSAPVTAAPAPAPEPAQLPLTPPAES